MASTIQSGRFGPSEVTFTINPSAQAGYVLSQDTTPTYSAARAGTGNVLTASVGAGLHVGQDFLGDSYGSQYDCYETFLDFNLATLTGTVSSATLSLGLALDVSTEDFTVEARTQDWGATLTTGDFVAGASLGGLTLLATLASSGIGAVDAYKAMTESGTALKDAVVAAGVGTLRLILCSDKHRDNTTPTSTGRLLLYAYNNASFKPKLVVVTT